MVRARRSLISGLLLLSLASLAACGSSSSSSSSSSGSTSPPPTVSALTLAPASVNGGQNVTATVTLSEPAQSGGLTFTVTSPSNSVVFNNQITYTIPKGHTSFKFQFQTLPVGSNQTALITVGTALAGTQSAPLVIIAQKPLQLTGFTLNTNTITSGGTVSGTITLDAAAFSPGQLVSVVSSDPAVIPVNPVTVPTGTNTVQFGIYTEPINVQRMATLTASLNSGTISAQLMLTPTGIAITSLNFIPASLAGGQSTTGIATISPPAPAGGVTISLTVAFANSATPQGTPIPFTVPATVMVPAGATQVQFTATATKVTTTTDLTVTANLGTTGASFGVEVVPSIKLTGIVCTPGTLTGGSNGAKGNTGTCTVSLSLAAASQGQGVTLTTSDSSALPVPMSVTVPAGAANFSFPVTAGSPSTTTSVTITATLAGSKTGSATTTVLVVPASSLAVISLVLNPATVLGGAGPTGTSTATLTISGLAPPGGLAVSLTSSDPSAQLPGMSVTVPQNATSATFLITTVAVSMQINATITATVNNSTQTATLQVVPPPMLTGVALSSTSVAGGSTVNGTINLAAAAPAGPGCTAGTSGVCVMLSSSSSFAQFVSSVTVPVGSTTAPFLITTLPVTTQQDVVITATLGTTTVNVTLTLTPSPPDVRLLFFNPPTVTAGGMATGTVVLTAVAPAGGSTVTLTSANAAVTVPATVTVPAGQTTATFPATTATSTAASTGVAITAEVTSSVTTTLTVIAAPTATVSEQIVAAGETDSTDFPTHACPAPTGATMEFCGPLPSGDDTGFVTSINQSTPTSGTTASTLSFSTFVGISSFGQVRDVFVDSSGNVFACGVTSDPKLPTTSFPAQAKYGGGNTDVFIVEFNSSGALQYLSYLGGSGDETCYSITVGSNGNLFISGKSNSTDLMGTAGVFQPANAGGYDFFVASINYTTTNANATLTWLTFVGSMQDDFADGRIAVGSTGSVYVSGTTTATSCRPPQTNGFPLSACPNLNGVGAFGVVLQLSPDGTQLLSSTAISGNTNGANPGTPTITTAAGGIAFDVLGNLYVCGQTNASDLLVTSGAFQPNLKGQQDAYIARLASSTGAITALTYVGGTGTVQGCKGISVDSERNPVIVMPTDAADFASTFPATVPVVRATPAGPASGPVALSGPSDFAIVKLTSDLTTAVFSTLVGGSGSETGTTWAPGMPGDMTRVARDSGENLYFSLPTNSTDFPITSNALFSTAPTAGNQKVAIVKLSADGSKILYGTYLGGSSNNFSGSLAYHLN